ncbi:hypothetical protein BN159_p84 (plasmid) [Streptomyces davaonensis JCM 4913]|uniref:Uncharacterized protein n=1 Tax=Streptomyces davaonensis (strain DSM 101723 / JCM 4913 / KCC S-0913 / 768) TaxID=1214101 RepID=K4RGP0_STRDJ|nr:hypothetical protein BN159_p84 [Streptomyces davaonensis JCM 4913]
MTVTSSSKSWLNERFWWRNRTSRCDADGIAHHRTRTPPPASHLPVWKACGPLVLKNDRRGPPRFRPAAHALGGSGPAARPHLFDPAAPNSF